MPERKELQLQGPRPAALKISKDSHKIKKPPLAPPHPPPQRPVIIYTVSPKIIHTEPTEFKDLVQRLTGHRPSDDDDDALNHPSNTTTTSMLMSMPMITNRTDEGVERVGHGILSPTPGLLPPISPNIFTPPPQATMPAVADLSPFTHFFQDLSPIATNHFSSSSLDFFQQNFPDFH